MTSFNTPKESGESAIFSRRIFILLTTLYVLEGLYFVAYGNLNQDEGWYLYASKLVYKGQVPYVDFAYFQTPLLPYIYGIPQLLFGSSILVGRLTSFIFGLGVLYFSTKLAKKITGTMAAGIVTLILCSTSFLVYVFSITKTEPLTSFLAVFALYSLLAHPATFSGAILSVSSMLWASAVRVSYFPSFLLILGIVLYRNSPSRARIGTILLTVLAQGSILFGLPLWLARDRMLFNVILAQLGRASRLPTESYSYPWHLVAIFFSNIVILQHFMFVIALLALAMVAVVRFAWRGSTSHPAPTHKACATIGSVALAVYLPNLVPPTWLVVYFVPTFCMLAILIGVALDGIYTSMTDRLGKQFVLSFVLALFASQLVMSAAISQWQYATVDSPHLKGLSEAADYIQGAVPEDMELVTFSTYIAVEANRKVAEGLEMSVFSFFPLLSDAEATRYSVVNRNLLRRALLSPKTGAALLIDSDLRMLTSPAWDPKCNEGLSQDELTELLPELNGQYTLTRVIPDFGQWQDNLYILLRTDM